MGSERKVLVKCPLKKPTTVTCKYGEITPGYRDNKPHNGIDFKCAEGEEAGACFDGIVRCAVPKPDATDPQDIKNNRLGNYLVLWGDGYRAKYAHLSEFKVRSGQKVKAGEIVALTGNTGVTTGPHLHFDLRDNKTNEYVEPVFEET